MARKLVVEIIGDASSLERSFKQAGHQTETFGQKFAKVGKIAAVAGAAIGVAAIEIGKKFAEAAITAQEETGKLNKALEINGQNAKELAPQINKLESANRRLGFTNSDTRDSLTKLFTAGENVKQATRDMGLAADFARVKNVSLGEATQVLVRAHAGNLRALKALGISVVPVTKNMDALRKAHQKSGKAITYADKAAAKAADNQATYAIVAARLQKAIGGQADEFSKSAKGGMEQFHAQLQNLEETIGAKLLPVIAKMLKFLNDLLAIFTSNSSASDKFQKALERMGISAKTTAQLIGDMKDAFNILRTVVVTTFNVIRPVLEAFWQQIKGIVQLVSDLLHGRWSKIWGDAVTVVRNTVHLWVTILKTGISLLGGIALKIGAAIGTGILNGLKGLAEKIIQLILVPINAIIRQINKLPFVNIPELGKPKGAPSGAGTAGSRRSGGLPPAVTGLSPTPHPVTGPPAGGRGAVVFNGPVNVHGVNNPSEFIKWAQRQARVTSPSRSGPFGGHNVGLT